MRPTRAHVAYLVILLAMMSCLAVVQAHPLSLSTRPDHWIVAGVLALGAAAVALRRPFSYPVGLGTAFFAMAAGFVSLRGYWGIRLPGLPWVWILGGLYVAFRLALNQQALSVAKNQPQSDQEEPGEAP